MIVYKIRNKNDSSKFLKGTPTYNSWDKSGRIFLTLGKLRTFLTNSLKGNSNVGNWDIVEYELTELSAKGVHEMIKPEQLVKMLKK